MELRESDLMLSFLRKVHNSRMKLFTPARNPRRHSWLICFETSITSKNFNYDAAARVVFSDILNGGIAD